MEINKNTSDICKCNFDFTYLIGLFVRLFGQDGYEFTKKQDMLITSVQNDPCIRLNDFYQIMLQFKTNHLVYK